MNTNVEFLFKTLMNFAENPQESWGKPTDGCGNSRNRFDVLKKEKIRVSVEKADRNTARIDSGTYTKKQYADFQQQLRKVERDGCGTAVFPGDFNNLPEDIAERTCLQCNKIFRSAKTDVDVKCYACCLDQLCSILPGRQISDHWRYDDWRLDAYGDVGFSNQMTFFWYNSNSRGNMGHQGLVVYRNEKMVIKKMVFSTVAERSRRCYTITFQVHERMLDPVTVAFARADKVSEIRSNDVADRYYAKFVDMEEFDELVLDLIVAMLPSWMLNKHRPRNPYPRM